jgi:monoterpene epsilon-lactone hydrolase
MTSEPPTEGHELQIDQDGVVHVPAHRLPLSAALSGYTRSTMAAALSRTPRIAIPRADDFTNEEDFKAMVEAFRERVDTAFARPMSERLLEQFPVSISQGRIGGVPVEEFMPLDRLEGECILINLHGGAFFSGATYVSRTESIPMAHLGNFRVVSVDYRQGYEHKFPAASEDVAAVYSELLKTYAPTQIGIYGGSAGGVLTAQATAWILEHELPAPGAIGIFGAGTGGRGDSDYFAAIGTGSRPPLGLLGNIAGASVGYFSNAREDDHLVDPCIGPEAFRARFPPTLLITGTRSFDMSPAIATHRALVQAGVDASLHVFDGVAHCFYYDAAAPEGADAYQTIIRFFRRYLSAA